MADDIEYNEKAYTTGEMAIMLGIAVPTVRKYAQSLERASYVFIKGKGKGKYQSRLFLQNDIMAFRYLKQLRDNSHITVDEAVSIVISKFGKGAIQSVRHNDTPAIPQYDKQYNELKEMIHNQNELINKMSKQLDQQQEYFKNEIQSMNESLETRKQISAAEENKQSFFSKLFKKNK